MKLLHLFLGFLPFTIALHVPPDTASLDPRDAVVNIGDRCRAPGITRCAEEGSTLAVCSDDGIWVKSADCGKGCCVYKGDIFVPSCDCIAKPPKVGGIGDQKRNEALQPTPPTSPLGGIKCSVVGAHGCDYPGMQYIGICGTGNVFNIIADCGGKGCCRFNAQNRQPYCDCRASPAGRTMEKEVEVEVQKKRNEQHAPPKVSAQYCDVIGEYVCDVRDSSAIGVCNSQHRWQLVARCGGPGCCNYNPQNKIPYCDCRKAQEPKKRSELSRRASQASNQACNEFGRMTCDIKDQQFIGICNARNEWQILADCGGPHCCKWNNINNSPYCDCRKDQSDTIQNGEVKPEHPSPTTLPLNEFKKGAEARSPQFGCIPPGFPDEDSCLNVCGPRYPPCFAYCTCKSKSWPLSTRNPTATPTPIPTLQTYQRA